MTGDNGGGGVDLFHEWLAFFKAHPVLTTTNAAMCAVWPLSDIIVPLLSGKIVSAIESGSSAAKVLAPLLAALVATLVFFSLLFMLVSYHDGIFIPRMQNFVRHRMIERLMREYETNVHDLPGGEIVSKLARVPMVAVYIIDRIKTTFVPYGITFLVSSLYVATIDPAIGAVMLIGIAAILYLALAAPFRSCKAEGEAQEALVADIHEQTEDAVRNLSSVYAANTIADEMARIGAYEEKFGSLFMATTQCVLRQRALGLAALAAMASAIGWLCYKKLRARSMTTGQFVTIFMIIMTVCNSLSWITTIAGDLIMEWSTLATPPNQTQTQTQNQNQTQTQNQNQNQNQNQTQTQNQTQNQTRRPELRDPADLSLKIGDVSFEGVTYAVPLRGKPLVSGVTFSVPAGQRVAVVGSIGSGKTTLMKMLVRFLEPTSGAVRLGGVDVRDWQVQDLRRRVGYVAQQPTLFDRTILENMVYGSRFAEADAQSRIESILRSLGLQDAFASLAGGLRARAGKNGSNLSGGQRQVVQCVRMLLWDPDVVVLDEVTASVDPATKDRLMALIGRMTSGRTAFIITHDASVLQLADRIITMSDGRVIGDELMKTPTHIP